MEKKKFLTRQDILSKAKLPTESVFVEEWDGEVILRGMTAKERDAWEADMIEFNNKGQFVRMKTENMRAKLVAKTAVNEEGKLLFTAADVEAIGELPASSLDKLYKVAEKLSALRPIAQEEKEKNSQAVPSDSSPTN